MRIWPFTLLEKKSIAEADLEELIQTGAGRLSRADALRVPAVANAVQIISEAVASLDVMVKRIEGANELDVPGHAVLPLLRDEACDWVTGFEAIRQIVVDALTSDQGGMLWVNRVNGKPVELLRYVPGVLTFDRDVNTGERIYRRFGSIIPARDVVHLLPPLGHAPLSLAMDAISTAAAIDRHVRRLFTRGAKPSGALLFPKGMGEDSVKKARAAWRATHEGEDAGGSTAILHDGADYKPLTMTSTDGQLLENRRFQIGEIARAFNLPVSLLGDLERATWGNSEQQQKLLIGVTLEPWLRSLEGALRRALFDDAERRTHVIRFDREDFSRADLSIRATVINSLIASQTINNNEGRAWLGLAPREGGNVFRNPNITQAPALPAPDDEDDHAAE